VGQRGWKHSAAPTLAIPPPRSPSPATFALALARSPHPDHDRGNVGTQGVLGRSIKELMLTAKMSESYLARLQGQKPRLVT
jgi:hypothetical protein